MEGRGANDKGGGGVMGRQEGRRRRPRAAGDRPEVLLVVLWAAWGSFRIASSPTAALASPAPRCGGPREGRRLKGHGPREGRLEERKERERERERKLHMYIRMYAYVCGYTYVCRFVYMYVHICTCVYGSAPGCLRILAFGGSLGTLLGLSGARFVRILAFGGLS